VGCSTRIRAHASANAQMSDFELDSDELSREFVIMVPLPGDRLRPDSTVPKQHRYRALDVALAAQLQSFRAEHNLSQAEVAAAVGASHKSVVTEWESAVTVPSGLRKRRLIELLEGKLWKVLREGVMVGEKLPLRWKQAVRRYRRASRSVGTRRTVGEAILSTLNETRELTTISELLQHYRGRDSGWPRNPSTPMPAGATVRLAEDAAFGLRWIEIVTGITFDPRASLVGILPLKLS
jgi:DNA-binding XRE family transcriptional regulator